jgi:PPP family 3-phenylpropionic acid transporter
MLALCSLGSAIAALAFIPAHGFATLFVVSLFHAAFVAPTTTLSDALALRNATPQATSPPRFEYGWVRGTGSAAFILGSLASGQTLNVLPAATALVGQGLCLVASAAAALMVPEIVEPQRTERRTSGPRAGLSILIWNRAFWRLVLVAALLLGSHAMHDSFAMIAWTERGITPGAASLLWSGSVAAEVVVFFWVGPWLLRRTGPLIAMTLSAIAAIVRWIVLAQTSSMLGLALVEPLHGFTFALFHLACMRVLVRITPAELAASAQAIYAFGTTLSAALLTWASGYLYARLDLAGFLFMAALAAASLPSIWALSHALRERTKRS